MHIKKRDGFTLIELLVVIAIIGLLASVISASFNSARVKSRDARRIADMDALKKALALYELDTNTYPSSVPPGPPWKNSCEDSSDWIRNLVADEYIAVLPVDPVNDISDNICYYYRSDGVDFKLAMFMERDENKAAFAQTDGGREDDWYEIFTPGGQAWQLP